MSGNKPLFNQFVSAVQGHEEGLQHASSRRSASAATPPRQRLRRLGRQVHDLDLPQDVGPQQRPGARHAGQDPVPHARRRAAARPAPTSRCPCTRCAATAATTSPRRSGRSGPRAATSASSYGLIGYHTKQILGAPTARGRIPLRSTGLDYHPDDNFDLNHDGEDDLILDYYTPPEVLRHPGHLQRRPQHQHGAHRLLQLGQPRHGQGRDLVHHPGPEHRQAYLSNFNFEWNSGRNSRNAYTTTYTDFRVARMERQADGTRKVYVTVRRPVTTVERDPFKPGRYWEARLATHLLG